MLTPGCRRAGVSLPWKENPTRGKTMSKLRLHHLVCFAWVVCFARCRLLSSIIHARSGMTLATARPLVFAMKTSVKCEPLIIEEIR